MTSFFSTSLASSHQTSAPLCIYAGLRAFAPKLNLCTLQPFSAIRSFIGLPNPPSSAHTPSLGTPSFLSSVIALPTVLIVSLATQAIKGSTLLPFRTAITVSSPPPPQSIKARGVSLSSFGGLSFKSRILLILSTVSPSSPAKNSEKIILRTSG